MNYEGEKLCYFYGRGHNCKNLWEWQYILWLWHLLHILYTVQHVIDFPAEMLKELWKRSGCCTYYINYQIWKKWNVHPFIYLQVNFYNFHSWLTNCWGWKCNKVTSEFRQWWSVLRWIEYTCRVFTWRMYWWKCNQSIILFANDLTLLVIFIANWPNIIAFSLFCEL